MSPGFPIPPPVTTEADPPPGPPGFPELRCPGAPSSTFSPDTPPATPKLPGDP